MQKIGMPANKQATKPTKVRSWQALRMADCIKAKIHVMPSGSWKRLHHQSSFFGRKRE